MLVRPEQFLAILHTGACLCMHSAQTRRLAVPFVDRHGCGPGALSINPLHRCCLQTHHTVHIFLCQKNVEVRKSCFLLNLIFGPFSSPACYIYFAEVAMEDGSRPPVVNTTTAPAPVTPSANTDCKATVLRGHQSEVSLLIVIII